MVALLHLAAVLSVSIGLLNLFPVPLLDGGHLLFYAIEGTRGRPLSDRAQEIGFRIAQSGGKRSDADARFYCRDQTQHAGIARRHLGVRNNFAKPLGSAVLARRFIESRPGRRFR